MRFESPTSLQKHKREGHRRARDSNGLRGQGAEQASFLNTQAGPHKCERINPSTGKPKPRCDVCTEEKTFSRADALTRH
ncbi:hypothetical protein FJTKL_00805 [Diaporthe vaccinii]|uniref:C2H2-type domain-containing protein n=1 Tax=Diaporthe vaccinii TaxID=105482 RepID=A0ABR4E2E7_9PEZI